MKVRVTEKRRLNQVPTYNTEGKRVTYTVESQIFYRIETKKWYELRWKHFDDLYVSLPEAVAFAKDLVNPWQVVINPKTNPESKP